MLCYVIIFSPTRLYVTTWSDRMYLWDYQPWSRLRLFDRITRSDVELDHHRALRASMERSPASWRRPRERPRQISIRTVESDLRPTLVGRYTLYRIELKTIPVCSGVTRVFRARGQKQWSAPAAPQSRDVGITPTVRFSVKVTLCLPELSFFCKVTTSKFIMQNCTTSIDKRGNTKGIKAK